MKSNEKPKMVIKPYKNVKEKQHGWQMIEEPPGISVYVIYKPDCDELDAETSAIMKKHIENYATIKKLQFNYPK